MVHDVSSLTASLLFYDNLVKKQRFIANLRNKITSRKENINYCAEMLKCLMANDLDICFDCRF